MNTAPQPTTGLTGEHRRLLEVTYRSFHQQGTWPTRQYVDKQLDHLHGLDLESLLIDVPPGLVQHDAFRSMDSRIALTVAGLAAYRDANHELALFLGALRWAADAEKAFLPSDVGETERLRLKSDQARAALTQVVGSITPPDVAKIYSLFTGEGLIEGGSQNSDEPWKWEIYVGRDIRRFRSVRQIGDYLEVHPPPPAPARHLVAPTQSPSTFRERPAWSAHRDERSRPSVFISYSHADKSVARLIAAGLDHRGCQVWIDEGELKVGESVIERISQGVGTTDYLVALVSASSVDSHWCQKELSLAMTGELNDGPVSKVLPIRIGEVRMPAPIADKLYLPVNPEQPELVVQRLFDDILAHHGAGDPDPQDRPASLPAPRPPLSTEPSSERPSDPEAVRAEVVGLLRAGDGIGLNELLRVERRAFTRAAREVVAEAQVDVPGVQIDIDRFRLLETDLTRLLERRLASIYPLVQYDEQADNLAEELRGFATLAAADWRLGASSYAAWAHSPRWLAWSLVYATGALACALEHWTTVRQIWEQRELEDRREPLPAMRLLAGDEFAQGLQLGRFGKRLALGPYWHLASILAKSEMCDQHYEELAPVLESSLHHLSDFSWLVTALGGRDGVRVIKWWTGVGHYAGDGAASRFPAALQTEPRLSAAVSRGVFGLEGSAAIDEILGWAEAASGSSEF